MTGSMQASDLTYLPIATGERARLPGIVQLNSGGPVFSELTLVPLKYPSPSGSYFLQLYGPLSSGLMTSSS